MRSLFTSILLSLFTVTITAQYAYDTSVENPFGLPNPDAPEQLKDFAPMIGECDCISIKRNPDSSWDTPKKMYWRFKYILNGMAVQDDAFIEDGSYGGSIRQFIADSTRWYVHYYSSRFPSTTLPAWEGVKNDSSIILYRAQTAPNGMEGFYKITFYDMNETGYKWKGDWVNPDESIVYPTWTIECTRRESE